MIHKSEAGRIISRITGFITPHIFILCAFHAPYAFAADNTGEQVDRTSSSYLTPTQAQNISNEEASVQDKNALAEMMFLETQSPTGTAAFMEKVTLVKNTEPADLKTMAKRLDDLSVYLKDVKKDPTVRRELMGVKTWLENNVPIPVASFGVQNDSLDKTDHALLPVIRHIRFLSIAVEGDDETNSFRDDRY